MCHVQTDIALTYCHTRQESMENQKVMCHVQTDMALTRCDYKAGDHEKSESDVPHSNRHGTYIL